MSGYLRLFGLSLLDCTLFLQKIVSEREGFMEAVLGLLILVADIYAIIKILQSSASGLKKLIWVLVVLIFPVIGLIVWFFAGPGGKSD